jgi:hypothetical protein
MPENAKSLPVILNETLKLIREAETNIIKLKERDTDLRIDPEMKSASEKLRNDFIEQVYDSLCYWYDLPGKTLWERMNGAIFSVLVILDGECAGMPPFAVRPLDEDGREGEDIAGNLHALFGQKSEKEKK